MSIDEDETRRGRRHVFLLRCPIEEEEEVLRPESALLLRAPTAATPAGEEEEEEEVENIIFSLSLYLCSNASFDRYARGEMTRFSYLTFLHFYDWRERENKKKRRNGAPSLQQRR
jgi:hypothetical protein